MKARVELTDTFNGEANYSWVRRQTISTPEYDTRPPPRYQATVMRRAKAAVGLTGYRGRTEAVGGNLEFRPYGCNMVLFVIWDT